jgi:molecular chaperone HtpG
VRVWSKRIPFKVDIAGIIEIMGSSLYSRPDTPIRELIQNAHDAIMRRRNRELEYQGRIDIVQYAEQNTISFTDDGIGLSAEEAEEYLGTLGIGITGLLKGRGSEEARATVSGSGDQLIGQFGIGLFSSFMLAELLVVESRRADCPEGVRWAAGPGTDIELSSCPRLTTGTTVTLHLKPNCELLASNPELLESAIKQFADFIPIPIYVNGASARSNLINVAWFSPTPDAEAMEMDLASYFHETPLEVIPIRASQPVHVEGALYISPQRTPGFSDDAVVAATIRRMVISRRVQDLLPPWASFLRGILELPDCSPTASREDLVRDEKFGAVQMMLEEHLYDHFRKLAKSDPQRLEAIINWHRFTIAGSSLEEAPLRDMLRQCYRFSTTSGDLTFEQVLEKSQADALVESEADRVIWYNADRRQERWLNEIFRGVRGSMCVHALRSFEESMLAAMVADTTDLVVDLRIASPSSENFASSILGIRDLADASDEWIEFLGGTNAKVMLANFRGSQPVMAFLNERYELSKTFEGLKKDGDIPAGFQRLIDAHFRQAPADKNEVILNRKSNLIERALAKGVSSPLASVVRMLVRSALHSAGASLDGDAQVQQLEDLNWIADNL